LNDIKQLFVEEACDSSEENNVELTHSSCNMITEYPTVSYVNLQKKNKKQLHIYSFI